MWRRPSASTANIGQGRFLQEDDGDAILIGKGLADRSKSQWATA